MASSSISLRFLSSFLLFLLFSSSSEARTSFRPKALVLPVTKDASTLQYLTTLSQRTPLVPLTLTVDLGGPFMWVDCELGYVSSSYSPGRCRSAQCALTKSDACGDCVNSPRPGCNTNTCGLFPENTVFHTSTIGELAQDVLSLQSTNGSNPGRLVTAPRFLFTCGNTDLLQDLARGVKGMAGFGRNRIALPLQLASVFSFHRKFAICLSSSTTSKGAIFLGDGPYVLQPNMDVSQSLVYTPLILNPVSTAGISKKGDPSDDYFIGVKSIKIDDKRVVVNSSLLSIDSDGVGGTKLSTVEPYTTLETTIYNAVTEAFIKAARAKNISRVASVSPFGACFSSKGVSSTRLGAGVPQIDLVLQNESTIWRIFGANSMVFVKGNVLCLGFVDGGPSPRTSVVIGGHQLEDNLLQFDFAATPRLGFSSSLLGRRTTCANFDFSS